MEAEQTRPTAEVVARPLIILTHLAKFSLMGPLLELPVKYSLEAREKLFRQMEDIYRQLWQRLKDAGLWPYLSPREQIYANSRIEALTKQQIIDGSWKLEAAGILAWTLGLEPKIPSFDTMVDHDLMKRISFDDMKSFIREARLRNASEIDDARALAEFWHWRSRTRELIERDEPFPDDEQLKTEGLRSYDDIVRVSVRAAAKDGLISSMINEDFAAKGKAYRDLSNDEWSEIQSITMERHYTLNWVCGYAPENKWDETPTDT